MTSLRISKSAAPAVIGVAIRKQNRAAASRSRPANRPAEIEMPDRLMPGTSASAWAAPMPIATGKVTSSIALGPAAPAVGQPQDHRADDERDRDEPDARGRSVSMTSLSRNAGDRGRDRRGDQQPGQPAVRVAAERAVADRREPGRDEAEPVRPEVDEQRQPACRCGASR